MKISCKAFESEAMLYNSHVTSEQDNPITTSRQEFVDPFDLRR